MPTITVETASSSGEFISRREIPWDHNLKNGVVRVRTEEGWVQAGRTTHASQRAEDVAREFCVGHHIEVVALTGSRAQGAEALAYTYGLEEERDSAAWGEWYE